MRHNSKLSLCSLVALLTLPLCAQDLAPRAYVITAVHSNAVTVTWTFDDGGFDVNGAVPAKALNQASADTPVPRPQSEAPVGSFEGHWSYDFKKPRMWASLDGNFWWGGTTTLNGIRNPDTRQTGSRLGGTFAYPFTKHQSLKISYSAGTYIRFGGNYQNVQVAWQYSWLGLPKINQKK
jgi:hypothetical protein